MIEGVTRWISDTRRVAVKTWNRFWFSAAAPSLLGLLRIGCGAMLFYTHLVWSLELMTFFSPGGVLPRRYGWQLYDGSWMHWTHFDWVQDPTGIWIVHVVALVTMAMFTIGLFTRVTSILSFLFVVSYAHRATGALFGLDQINCFLTLYLAIGPSGDAWSLDRWWGRRQGRPSVGANMALRLIQVHLCISYLFAGLAKLQGVSWWNGEAFWGAIASLDYQTLDLTWMANQMWLVNLLTLVSLAWEISYAFLIWNPRLRPLYLALAIGVHGGIALAMGMITFGLIMILANLSFLPPDFGAAWFRGPEAEQGAFESKRP